MKKNIFVNKSNRKIILSITAVIVIGIFYGCANMDTKDNKLYEVNQDKNQNEIKKIDGQVITKGINSFCNFNLKWDSNKFPVTVSKDKRYVFYTTPSERFKENDDIISGDVVCKFNLVLYDMHTKKDMVLKEGIPLVTVCKWNKKGNIVAFSGGEVLNIYDIERKKFIFEDEVKGDYVTYFGWSPDGKRLYTEHTTLVNNTIYYMDSKEKIESYNCNESKYYKGNLDREYYYATTNEITKSTFEKASTLIVDSKGNKIRKLYDGKYRDAFGLSTLLIGENDFGLYCINNINDSYEPLLISREYIYDAKFIFNGNIAYTIKNRKDNVNNENNFIMVLVDSKGKKYKTFTVSGGKFLISPDGKKALVSGENREIVNFDSNTLEFSSGVINKEKEQIFRTIRGASEVVVKYMCTGKNDINETEKYFANNENLNQCALFDMESIYKEKNEIIATVSCKEYDIKLKAEDYKVTDNSVAYVKLLGNMKNSGGNNNNIRVEVELTYNVKENKWYITGLSNFYYTDEYKKVKEACNEYISKSKEGKLFDGLFKGKDLSLFQIQFWDIIGRPGLAFNIEQSNYCKVYLKVKEGSKESVYKLILHKDIKGNWEISELNNKRISYLY